MLNYLRVNGTDWAKIGAKLLHGQQVHRLLNVWATMRHQAWTVLCWMKSESQPQPMNFGLKYCEMLRNVEKAPCLVQGLRRWLGF